MDWLRRHTGALLIVLVAGLAGLAYPMSALTRLNLLVYDLLLPVQAPPMSERVVVVGIDNRSLEALGRWPWDRSTHAALIDRLTTMGATAIGMDVIFSESQRADEQLIAAVSEAPIVLPVAPSIQEGSGLITELMPLPNLALAADALAHVDVELDQDGLTRSTFLFGGLQDPHWPSMALAMLAIGQPALANEYEAKITRESGVGWVRAGQLLVPFTRPDQQPLLLSFSDVLAGKVEPDVIANSYVLIGVTATGLGDAISSPGAAKHERIPGVVLIAQVLNGLMQQRMLTALPAHQGGLLTAVLVAVTALLMMRVPAQFGWAMALLGVITVIGSATLLLSQGLVWFAPVSALCAIALLWPVWLGWQQQRTRLLANRLLLQLEHQTQYSLEAGLPNSGMLGDQLRHLGSSPSHQGFSALLVMHVHWPESADYLDRIQNDSVLRVIGAKIQSAARPHDFVAHLNGDDFAVLMPGLEDRASVEEEAQRLVSVLEAPIEYNGEHRLLAPEVGLSIWPTDSHEPAVLLRNAYTAMLKSRLDDGNSLSLYSASLTSEMEIRSQLEQALVFALERGEFEVHYQPQVSANTGDLIGVEALLRWENPVLGRVSPEAFIPVAENVGLIRAIGAWVIEETCQQLKRWNQSGFEELRLAINVSPLQFLVPGLAEEIQALIHQIGIDPGKVELEITESSLMQDIDRAIEVMKHIKANGLELAIDDFGTGYSSLSNLRRFPLDRLKIDQAFTREIGVSAEAEKITLTIIQMAQHLGLNTIAEGIETEDQAQFLRTHGCDEFQGFLYGKPMSAAQLTEYLGGEQ